MGDTKIEWTEKTWNPIRARNKATGKVGWFCEHVSHGCDNCYAEKMNVNTYFGNGLPYKASFRPELELFLDEDVLTQPLRWRKPGMIFPCSMTDLFGRFVKDEWIDRILAVVALAHWHTFQGLTKRAKRAQAYFSGGTDRIAAIWDQMGRYGDGHTLLFDVVEKSPNHDPYWPFKKGRQGYFANPPWPLLNLWLGVSVEDQKTADERIPLLLFQTPAAVRWISAEPLLGPIDLVPFLHPDYEDDTAILKWVVVGGESGPNARPMDLAWTRSIVEQCKAAAVPVFVKQLGARPVYRVDSEMGRQLSAIELPITDVKGGDINEWPEDLRVREYPAMETACTATT